MQLNEQNILSALRAVQDPDLHKNIVELNFVQNLKIEGTKVSFDLRLTTPACPIRDRFKDQCIAITRTLARWHMWLLWQVARAVSANRL